ncbi:MAG: class I SAM-dependent methyltransferase [Candidatus Zixiibacteriota bacterium]|nr:MAG: class I SAM-dependent methyltransferase [candidate division Zixibacteria bacterium]
MPSITYAHIADLYDEYVRTDLDVPFFLQETRNAGGEALELMSGTGRLSLPLIRAGRCLTCVDYTPELLALLRQKLEAEHLSAEVVEADVRRLDLGRQFDLVILPFHSFAELLSPEDQLQALRRIHTHLKPGGRFICSLHNPAVRTRKMDGTLRLWGQYPREDGRLLFWGAETYDPGTGLASGVELFEEYDAAGVLRAKRAVELRFRLVERAEFEAMATVTGFAVAALYGSYSYAEFDEASSPFMIWVLRQSSDHTEQ